MRAAAALSAVLLTGACFGADEFDLRARGFEEACAGFEAQPEAARDACGVAIERIDPEDETAAPMRARLLSDRGAAALLTGDAAAAEADQTAALEIIEDAPLYRTRRGWARLALDRPRDALADFEAALAADGANRRARLGRGSAFLAASAPARALPDLEAARAEEPGLVFAHLQYARALAELGRVGEAAAAYNRVLALRPGDADALIERARMRESFDREAARIDYDRAVREAREPAKAYYARGRFYDRLGERAAAEADLERAYALGLREPYLADRLRLRDR